MGAPAGTTSVGTLLTLHPPNRRLSRRILQCRGRTGLVVRESPSRQPGHFLLRELAELGANRHSDGLWSILDDFCVLSMLWRDVGRESGAVERWPSG